MKSYCPGRKKTKLDHRQISLNIFATASVIDSHGSICIYYLLKAKYVFCQKQKSLIEFFGYNKQTAVACNIKGNRGRKNFLKFFLYEQKKKNKKQIEN